MSVLNKIAYLQGRRDEIPNQELAKELATRKDRNGIREIAENLWNKDKNIQSDCLKSLEKRMKDMRNSQATRLRKVIRDVGKQ